MKNADIVNSLLIKTNKRRNAIFEVAYIPMIFVPTAMDIGPVRFGNEVEKMMLAEMRKVAGVELERAQGNGHGSMYMGVIARPTKQAVEKSIKRLGEVVNINPFQRDHFERAESYLVEGRHSSLRHVLVGFYQDVVKRALEDDPNHMIHGLEKFKVRPYAKQLVHVRKPLILETNPGNAQRQIKNYVEGNWDEMVTPLEMPSNFNVVDELGLAPLLGNGK